MTKLLVIADSRRYIRNNCYLQQLYKTLRRQFDTKLVTMSGRGPAANLRLDRYDHVLSLLRLRSLDRHLDMLAPRLTGKQVFVYEQDPWEAYAESGHCKGAYERIDGALNVKAFLNTSRWWSEFITARGLPSRFVRMGMLPELCNVGRPWGDRKVALGFQGTLHPHRKLFFDDLAERGHPVTVLPSASYRNYLKALHNIRIYIHTEDAPWTIDGKVTPRNALWIKDTEAAARGCFSIRDYEDEAYAYGINEIPTIYTYREVAEVPDIIREIQTLSDDEKNRRMREATETLRRRDDWQTVVEAIRRD